MIDPEVSEIGDKGKGKIACSERAPCGREDLLGLRESWIKARESVSAYALRRKGRLENQKDGRRVEPNLGLQRIKEKVKSMREDLGNRFMEWDQISNVLGREDSNHVKPLDKGGGRDPSLERS